MSNKHSAGPRCPICQKTFRTAQSLNDHQHNTRHFIFRTRKSDEELAREKLAAYHAEKIGAKR